MMIGYWYQYIDTFIYEMSRQEPKLEKCKKIDALKLEDDECDQVTKFNNLLGVRVLSIS